MFSKGNNNNNNNNSNNNSNNNNNNNKELNHDLNNVNSTTCPPEDKMNNAIRKSFNWEKSINFWNEESFKRVIVLGDSMLKSVND